MDNNKVVIFHGSEESIRKPRFGAGKNTNDYGRGFYCTQDIELAYFTFAKNFVANGISLCQLQEAMRLGKLGEQIVLKSQKAFEQIRFLEAHEAQAEVYYERKVARDRIARMEYRKNVRANPKNDDLLMIDIIREGIVDGDPRLL